MDGICGGSRHRTNRTPVIGSEIFGALDMKRYSSLIGLPDTHLALPCQRGGGVGVPLERRLEVWSRAEMIDVDLAWWVPWATIGSGST